MNHTAWKPTQEPLVGTKEAADFLGVQPQTIRLWACRKQIPFRKAGALLRFKLSELEAWTVKRGQHEKR